TAGLALLCTISSISPRTSHTVTYTLSLHDALPICGGEEEAEVRVHAADVHVVRPHQETERADGHDRPHHHPIAEDVFSCMDTEQVGDDSEGRQGDDVDLGMTEEPEQVLEQQRVASRVASLFSHRDDGGQ